MRTTLNLPDGLVSAANERAAATGRSFTSLVEEGLRLVLADDDEHHSSVEPLPAFGTPGAGFLVALDDREALWAALDADGQS